MRPDCRSTPEHRREDDARGAVARGVICGQAGEQEVGEVGEVPLGDLEGEVGGEAAEGGVGCEAVP